MLCVPTSTARHLTLDVFPCVMQGLSVVVGLVEDNMADNGTLTQIGVQCIWRVLEVHGAASMNHLCRLLSNAGLPHRLMRAMLSLSQEHQILLNRAEVHLSHAKPL